MLFSEEEIWLVISILFPVSFYFLSLSLSLSLSIRWPVPLELILISIVSFVAALCFFLVCSL